MGKVIQEFIGSLLKGIMSPLGGLIGAGLVVLISVGLFFTVLSSKSLEASLRGEVKSVTEQRNTARTERDGANRELGQCKSQLSNLEGQVRDQNNKIDSLSNASSVIQQQARSEIARANRLAENARRGATAILNGAPTQGYTVCQSAESVLRGKEG